MDTATQTLVATIAAAVAALGGMVAAIAGVVAVIYARRSLKEGDILLAEVRLLRQGSQAEADKTIAELQRLQDAAHTETRAHRATTVTLYMLLAEAQAARELELLREIARQVFEVTTAMRVVRENPTGKWHAFNDAQQVLAAQLAGLPDKELAECRNLASAHANPRTQDNPEDRATVEIQKAISQARIRLAETTLAADAQLKILTQ